MLKEGVYVSSNHNWYVIIHSVEPLKWSYSGSDTVHETRDSIIKILAGEIKLPDDYVWEFSKVHNTPLWKVLND